MAFQSSCWLCTRAIDVLLSASCSQRCGLVIFAFINKSREIFWFWVALHSSAMQKVEQYNDANLLFTQTRSFLALIVESHQSNPQFINCRINNYIIFFNNIRINIMRSSLSDWLLMILERTSLWFLADRSALLQLMMIDFPSCHCFNET